jgi:hypothetical protein
MVGHSASKKISVSRFRPLAKGLIKIVLLSGVCVRIGVRTDVVVLRHVPAMLDGR